MSGVRPSVTALPTILVAVAVGLVAMILAELVALVAVSLHVPGGYWVGIVVTLVLCVGIGYQSRLLEVAVTQPDQYRRVVMYLALSTGFFLFIIFGLALTISLAPLRVISSFRFGAAVGVFVGLTVGLFEARAIANALEAQRLALQAEQIERERDRFEEFARIVAHDLRNPLTVAVGHLEIGRKTGNEESYERVEAAHERMQTILEETLAVARQQTAVVDRDAVSLEELARASWESVLTPEASLVVEATATIEADPNRVRHVFENLYRNAIEHGGEGVTITVGDLEDGFFIADDGPGIPADRRDSVFEPGESSSAQGSGFGLMIVAGVAEAHGWKLAVTESAAGGAQFEVSGVSVVE